MAPAGGGDKAGRHGGPRICCGVGRGAAAGAGQNIGAESRSTKRKAAVMSRDSNNLARNGDLEVACEDPQTILKEIENLRSELDEDVKELGYCEENEKLRIELVTRVKEIQSLRKKNEELQSLNEELQTKNEEVQAKNDELQTKTEELKAKNDELQTKNEELKANNDVLQAKNEVLQAKNEELQANNEELQANNEELQAKCEGHHKNIAETLENQINAKRKHLRQLEALYSTMEFPLAQLDEGKRMTNNLCDEDSSSTLVDESLAEKSGVNGKTDDAKSKLELGVSVLDAEIHIKMEKLGEMLECEKFSQELGSFGVWKSIQTNMELQDIRKDLIEGLKYMPSRRMIVGIKRMGELNERSFQQACRRKYENDEADTKAAMLASIWNVELKTPSWHPFKIVEDDGRLKEVVDDDDMKLKQLRTEYGDDVCDAVKTALIEMNEHNPNGRCPISELWNFGKGRKATVHEVLKYVFLELRTRRQI